MHGLEPVILAFPTNSIWCRRRGTEARAFLKEYLSLHKTLPPPPLSTPLRGSRISGKRSSVEGARIEAPQVPRTAVRTDRRVWASVWGMGRVCILVHSPTLLTVCFCTVIHPRPDLQYPCPVWHSKVAQSKALEFLRKRAPNIIFHGGEYATNLITAIVETLSRDSWRQQLSQLSKWSWIRGHSRRLPPLPLPSLSPPISLPSHYLHSSSL